MIFDNWNPPWHGIITAIIAGLVFFGLDALRRYRIRRKLQKEIEYIERILGRRP